MVKNKKKSSYDKILYEFNQYNSNEELKKYEEIGKAYKEIRDFYEKKFLNSEIDLKIEKIRLERNLGKQFGVSISYIITFGISIMGALMSILIQETLKNINPHYWILNFIIIGILYFSIMKSVGKEAEKARPRDVMINISLKVLEDLEKEINENKAKQEKEANREKTIQQINQHIDSNNIIKTTVLPVIAEIAATTVVKKGIFNKVFGGFRKK